MKTLKACVLAGLLLGVAARWAISEQAQTIERMDPALDQLLPPDVRVEQIATGAGFKWTEGPVWVKTGFLLFAEIPSNSIRKWEPGKGVSVFLQPSGYQGSAPYGGPEPGSNGMTLDARGRLTVAGHAKRSVWRLESMEERSALMTVLADRYLGKRLNSPNDLVYRSDGTLYFTDPPYGLRTQGDQDPEKEQTVIGVYRIKRAVQQAAGAAPEATNLELLISDLPRPNGIAFSPDQKYLYVDNSQPKKIWMRYPVKEDGSLGTGTVFYDATADNAPGSPDGMKVDTLGNVYSAGPGGVWIFSRDGTHLGTIRMADKVGNLAFGDTDGKTLYITASANVYRARVKVAGVRP